MAITNGDIYRSGPRIQSLDFVGGGLPSYALVRTVIRFKDNRATFRDVIEFDYRAEFEETSWDRMVVYAGKDTYLTLTSDKCVLTGHMPAPHLLVIIQASEVGQQDPKESNYLLQFRGFVFEKVTETELR